MGINLSFTIQPHLAYSLTKIGNTVITVTVVVLLVKNCIIATMKYFAISFILTLFSGYFCLYEDQTGRFDWLVKLHSI